MEVDADPIAPHTGRMLMRLSLFTRTLIPTPSTTRDTTLPNVGLWGEARRASESINKNSGRASLNPKTLDRFSFRLP